MKEMISVEEAEVIVGRQTPRLEAESVALEEALGRTLARSIVSDADIPPFDNSAMDGYAVRMEDLMETRDSWVVSQEIQAGQYPKTALAPGTCARIMTGAPLPTGADAVIPIEWTKGDNPVSFDQFPEPGHAVRRAGEDVRAGQEVFEGGELVTPPVVGMLASLGVVQVPVCRRPACSIITTGNELVDPGVTPGPGQIRNSNSRALAAQVATAGGVVARMLTARDDRTSLTDVVTECLEDDVVIVSGGVSVGAYDFVKDVLRDAGVTLLFWGVKQRPGKPLLFGTRDRTIVFGLPGNPVSSSICFDRYVRPALGKMLGRRSVGRPLRSARLRGDIRKVRELRYFARGYVTGEQDGQLEVVPTGPQGSGIYSSMARAQCIIHLPEGTESPRAGDRVEVELITWWD